MATGTEQAQALLHLPFDPLRYPEPAQETDPEVSQDRVYQMRSSGEPDFVYGSMACT